MLPSPSPPYNRIAYLPGPTKLPDGLQLTAHSPSHTVLITCRFPLSSLPAFLATTLAGSSHYVTLAELVPAEKVIREKRRQARRQKAGGRSGAGGSGHGANDEDVLDV